MRISVVVAALLVAPLSIAQSLAQPVYRCQQAAGTSYQDQPCAGRGERLVLPLHRPSAGEVARSERRREQLRRFLRLAELRRLETAREMTAAPVLPDADTGPVTEPRRQKVKVIVLLPVDRAVHRSWHKRRAGHKPLFNKGRAGKRWPGAAICPLGLVNCRQVTGPAAVWTDRVRQWDRRPAAADRRWRVKD